MLNGEASDARDRLSRLTDDEALFVYLCLDTLTDPGDLDAVVEELERRGLKLPSA